MRVERSVVLLLGVVVLGVRPATWAKPTVTLAAPEVPTADVQKTLREIDSARLRGEVDDLRDRFAQRVKASPNDVLAKVYLAWCDFPAETAWNSLKAVAAGFPDVPWSFYAMGKIYLEWAMPEQAQTSFQNALADDPKFYPAIFGNAEVLLRLKRPLEAEARFRHGLEVADDAEGRAGLGRTLVELRRNFDARSELQRGLALWPDQPEALLALAKLEQAADPQASLRYAAKVTQIAPKDKAARRAVADMLFDRGEKDLAAKQYELLLRLGEKDAGVCARLLAIYSDLGNAEALERTLHMVEQIDRKNVDYPLRLAELAEARHALGDAETALREAMSRDPKRPEPRLRFARLMAKQQRVREALETYRAADADGALPADAHPELTALTAQLRLPTTPAGGSALQIYSKVSSTLFPFYEDRLRERGGLGGTIKLRVTVGEDGHAVKIEPLEDTVGDALLADHVYFSLKDARYAPGQRKPVFEFRLQPRRAEK